MQIETEPLPVVSPRLPLASREQISYHEVSIKAAILARCITALAENKSQAERKRLQLLHDCAVRLQGCLSHMGSH
jgi:hypothetical protein